MRLSSVKDGTKNGADSPWTGTARGPFKTRANLLKSTISKVDLMWENKMGKIFIKAVRKGCEGT